MALVVKDRVKDTTSTTGTGTVTLDNSPLDGFQAFSSIGNGSTTYYAIEDANKTGWEVGLGTYTLSGHTLARTTVLASSNSGSAITLSSGSHTVFCDYAAGKAFLSDEGLNKSFTADGAITAGKPVILESDGDVAQVTETTTGATVAEGWGAGGDISGYASQYNAVVDIGNDKVVMMYQDSNNSSYATAVVGTVSGSGKSITSGTPVVLKSSEGRWPACVWDTSASRLGLFWNDQGGSQYIFGSTATVSGTTITAGTATALNSDTSFGVQAIFDPDQNDNIVMWIESDSTDYNIHVNKIDISGATPSVSYTAATTSAEAHQTDQFAVDYDTVEDEFLVVYTDQNAAQVKSFVVTNSGTAFTLSSITSVIADSNNPTCVFDDSVNKFCITYSNTSDSKHVYAIVGTIASSAVTYGSAVDLNVTGDPGSNPRGACSSFDTNVNETLVAYNDDGWGIGPRYATISISGTVPSLVTSGTITGATASESFSGPQCLRKPMTSEAENPIVYVYRNSSLTKARMQVFEFAQTAVVTTNLDNNYFGVASTTVADTETVNVNVPGSINGDQTGLTIGSPYFSTNNGVVGTSGTQFLGKAISSTELALEEEPDNNLFGTADGAITAGKPVIVEADGDFAEVVSATAYSSQTALNDPSEKVRVVSDGSGTFLMAYQGTSLYTTIQAGSISGTTITWGTAEVFQSTDSNGVASWWDSSQSCFVVIARGTTSNSYVAGKTITVSGEAITVVDTSTTQIYSGSYNQDNMVGGFDSTANVGFIVNSRGNSPTKTSVICVSLDGSKNISWGTEVLSDNRIYYGSQFVHDSVGNANIAVIGSMYNSSTTAENTSVQAYIITISGTTPTIQTTVVLKVAAYKHGYTVYDANAQKTVCIYDDGTKVYYNVCSVSSGTLSAGVETEIATGDINGDTQSWSSPACYDPYTKKIGITYFTGSNLYVLQSGSVSGTSISWSTAIDVDTGDDSKHVNVVNANSTDSNALIVYWDNYDSSYNVWTIPSSNLTSENYIGIAQATVADTATVTVETVGAVNSSQSGLTAGQLYYVQSDGTITTSGSVVAGIGLSATELLVTKS